MPRNLFSLVFRYLLFALLFQKDLFLQLYLLAQLFLRGQIGEIFSLEQLFAAMENAISRHIFAGVGAKQQADGGIVPICTHQLVIHPYIHIHLSHILMCYLLGLQVYQEEALQDIIVEHQVNIKITHIRADMLLSGHKGKSLAHLHDKTLQMTDDTTLQFCLRKISIGLHKKLCHAAKTPNCGLGAATFSDC